jgi:uncharacterized protein (TIGR03000 family)
MRKDGALERRPNLAWRVSALQLPCPAVPIVENSTMSHHFLLLPGMFAVCGLLVSGNAVQAQRSAGGGGHSGGGHASASAGHVAFGSTGGHHSGYIGGGYGREHHADKNIGGYIGGGYGYIGGGYIGGGLPLLGGFYGGYQPAAAAFYPSVNAYPAHANGGARANPIYYARSSGGAAAGFGGTPAADAMPDAEPPAPAQAQDGIARVEVILSDPHARVWFDGALTRETGTDRLFSTPPLTSSGTYRIRAAWMDAGREVIQEKVVNVDPNQTTIVDFSRPAGG